MSNEQRTHRRQACLFTKHANSGNSWKRAFHRVPASTAQHTLTLSAFFAVSAPSSSSSSSYPHFLICIENRSTQIGPHYNNNESAILLLTFCSWLHSDSMFFEIYLKRVTNIDCILMKARWKHRHEKTNEFCLWNGFSVEQNTEFGTWKTLSSNLNVCTCWMRYSTDSRDSFIAFLR